MGSSFQKELSLYKLVKASNNNLAIVLCYSFSKLIDTSKMANKWWVMSYLL